MPARTNVIAQVRMKSMKWYTEVAIRSALIADGSEAVFVALSRSGTAPRRGE
jgi:hypothetical protein